MVKFADKGKLIAEFARSENINDGLNSLTQINTTPDATGKLSGNAARVELNYSYKDLEMKVYHNQADREFYNTAAPITAGRKESGIKGRAQLGKIGLAKLEAIRTEDLQSGVNQGVSASIERAISRIVAVELGLKYYNESENPALLGASQTAPYHGLTARTKITTQLPWQGSNVLLNMSRMFPKLSVVILPWVRITRLIQNYVPMVAMSWCPVFRDCMT